ncbi:transcriptional protein SWT1 isoform X2 [Dunckerocampus dactyliophorus]|uniref:transcriptional protein SWT1 isoform X2 n=1 Tax=Dunckerocampus dactyliophorus TaxID=161453 RepID=UPI002405F947|nr:transcriptional protein SWT1 isoform X2 [Dunckerocampus dactyliophorus]
MSERKRKHKKSSREEETSNERYKRERSKRKHNVNRHSSSTKDREYASLPVMETRQIKKAVYKLPARQETDKRHISKTDVAYSKTSSTSTPIHNDCSRKVEPIISGKDKVATGSQIKERRLLRVGSISNVDADDRKKEKTDSERSSDEKPRRMSPPRSKKRRTRPGVVLEEKRKQCLELLESKCKDMDRHKARDDSTTKEAKEPSQKDKETELVKDTCQKSQQLLLKEEESFDKDVKTSIDSTSQTSCIPTIPKVSFKIAKASNARPKLTPLHPTFKIPKKVQPALVNTNVDERSDATSTSRTDTCGTELSFSETSANNPKQTPCFVDVPPTFTFESKDKSPSLSSGPLNKSDAVAEQQSDQMQVAEELHLARSERRLEVDVMQSYGELTCMDIDPAEESTTYTLCKQPAQQDVILVLDTNILLSHLDYVKKMQCHGLGALGLPIVLIPWVVLQELDSLKKGKGLTGSVAHLACPAISYIYNSLKSKERHLWGQSMQQAAESNNSLMAENNDDKVLQCCLQYQSLYPGSALILCTNDKNLCSKAVLSGVKALSKTDLEAEVERSRHDLNQLQSSVPQGVPQIDLPVSSPMSGISCTPTLPHPQERATLSSSLTEKDRKRWSLEEEEEEKINRCVSEFEDCLQEVLSNVLEKEMKSAFDDLWQEIVYLKPPWTFLDVLHCFKKHWRAVFGFIVPRPKLQTVLNLIDFFKRGQSRDRSSTLMTVQEAKEFVKEFRKSSSLVPRALTTIDNIAHKLQHKAESVPYTSLVSDVVMNEDDDAKQPPATHQEVWAMFENIWCNVYQISVLSSSPGLPEVQVLLSIIKSNKIVDVDCRLTDTDLLECFSQQDYREKLRVGVNQLTELKEALDHCLHTMASSDKEAKSHPPLLCSHWPHLRWSSSIHPSIHPSIHNLYRLSCMRPQGRWSLSQLGLEAQYTLDSLPVNNVTDLAPTCLSSGMEVITNVTNNHTRVLQELVQPYDGSPAWRLQPGSAPLTFSL